MIKKKIKKSSALLLTAAFALSAMMLPKVQAAIAVEDQACSLEINVENSRFSEVRTLPITVDLYKVADMDMSGKYESLYSELDFSSVDSETSAKEWETLAAAAKEIVETAKEAESAIPPNRSVVTESGKAVVDELTAGMYLVDANQLLSDYYQYDFTPYLISLPNNYYYISETKDDTWVYDLTGDYAVGLKPEKSDRYGNLVINKNLDIYNDTHDGAAFVFQVEAYKEDIDTGVSKVVYSDVVSMMFTGPGTESIIIRGLPAGSAVTVTEVYGGSNYELAEDSDISQSVTICAEEEGIVPVSVYFKNTHNDQVNGGTGVVNSFLYNGESWELNAAEESPSEIQNMRPIWEQSTADTVANVTP